MDALIKNFTLLNAAQLTSFLKNNNYEHWNNYFSNLAIIINNELSEPSNIESDLIRNIQQKISKLPNMGTVDFERFGLRDKKGSVEMLSKSPNACNGLPSVDRKIQLLISELHDQFTFLSQLSGSLSVTHFHFPFDIDLSHVGWGSAKLQHCYFHGRLYLENSSISVLTIEFINRLELQLVASSVSNLTVKSNNGGQLHAFIDTLRTMDLIHLETPNSKGSSLYVNSLQKCRSMFFELGEVNSLDFARSDLSNMEISNTKLNAERAYGRNAFVDVTFSERTKFKDCRLDNMQVDRFALECLREYGGLSAANRASMNIVDDAATLRMSYSGLNKWIHLAAFISFVFPYAAFLYARILESRFNIGEQTETISLFAALWNYIKTGGVDWQYGAVFHPSFALFTVALAYNILRILLLRKTKILEEQEIITNLPSNFSFSDRILTLYQGTFLGRSKTPRNIEITWNSIFVTSKILFWIYLVAVLLNSFHFLTRQVPI